MFSTSNCQHFGIGYHPISFMDVKENDWYSDAVTFIAARDIAAGIGETRFAPEQNMTREEFTKFVALSFGYSWSGRPSGFTDIPQGSWYESYVGALTEAGIINGTGNGAFGTGQYISRQDMATILYAALQKNRTELKKIRNFNIFGDEPNIATYAMPAIKALYEAGIISGMGDNRMVPTASAPRSNMAVMLKNVLEID